MISTDRRAESTAAADRIVQNFPPRASSSSSAVKRSFREKTTTALKVATMLTADDMVSFEELGYCCVDSTLDGGLSPAELDAAEATWDRLVGAGVVGLSNSGPERPESLLRQAELAADRGFIDLMCHPFFERIAQQVLKSEAVRVIELGPHSRPPTGQPAPDPHQAREIWSQQAHIDFQITAADFDATPRRDLLGIWLWVRRRAA
jgi:hypothetical protein